MDEQAMREALARDTSIVELRALLASYEERLARGLTLGPESHAAQAHVQEPLFLLNDIAIDLRSSARDKLAIIEAPAIVDCSEPGEAESFSFVYKVTSGVFRVHPRRGMLTTAVIGPFEGRAPSGLIATAETAHPAAPAVRFHISTWRGEFDAGAIAARFGAAGQEARFLAVPPRYRGFLVTTYDPPAPDENTSHSAWGLLLATIADPPEEISNAWAEFSNIALIFPADSGAELRLLS